jgi:hypothetical protein
MITITITNDHFADRAGKRVQIHEQKKSPAPTVAEIRRAIEDQIECEAKSAAEKDGWIRDKVVVRTILCLHAALKHLPEK